MKKLLILIVVILIAAFAGWVTFSRDSGRAVFTIETEEFAEDARQVIEQGKEMTQEVLDDGVQTSPVSKEVQEPSEVDAADDAT